jgi:hypothetical protein
MILYANGCSHTAAAEAVIPATFAVDDGKHGIDRRPHPVNLAASWCTHLSRHLDRHLICHAESGSSNQRILRTTTQWINNNPKLLSRTFMVIQWTTWEREEWLHKGVHYQVNASGTDYVPQELQEKYKHYVIGVDYVQKTQEWHEKIWQFHLWLKQLGVPHLMYNAWSNFSDPYNERRDWGPSYLGPYSSDLTYNSVLKNNGFEWASPRGYHFRADGHCFWADYLLQYITENKILESSK